ncbi:MAG: hypothetical protein JOY71_00900 [Acetobacteraceae bacterium]|nr:hypothetical protein [Acetobacteraceae bacterium]
MRLRRTGAVEAVDDPRLISTAKVPTIGDAVKVGGFLFGWPPDNIEQLKAVEERYPGLDRVVCAKPLCIALDVRLADLDRFEEGYPGLRDTCSAAANVALRSTSAADQRAMANGQPGS